MEMEYGYGYREIGVRKWNMGMDIGNRGMDIGK